MKQKSLLSTSGDALMHLEWPMTVAKELNTPGITRFLRMLMYHFLLGVWCKHAPPWCFNPSIEGSRLAGSQVMGARNRRENCAGAIGESSG